MKRYDILIFIQAAADLRYALDIIEKNKDKKIQLFVIHVKGIYDFINTLKIQYVELQFQDYYNFKLKDVRTYFSVKKGLENLWKNCFLNNDYKDVYFFSRYYDFHTASIIVKLNNRSNVYYYDHYDTVSTLNDEKLKPFSITYFKRKYFAFVATFISGANFISIYRKRFLEFDYKKYSLKKILIKEKITVSPRYLYSLNNLRENNEQIIFLLSSDELKMLTNEGRLNLEKILNRIKSKGYLLCLKGHPRLGNPKEFEHFFDEIIPSYVPTEFIAYKTVFFTLGIMSSGLVYPSQFKENNVISIINLVEFKNKKDKLFYKDFLKEHSKNKVKFINDIDSLFE